MCGISGFLTYTRFLDHPKRVSIIQQMTAVLHNRGPDDEGIWWNHSENVYFGHRRLSIIDLSSLGHQPMRSSCGRYTLTYNGEVFNFDEIKKELSQKGHVFNSHSDTETILIAIKEWGLFEAVSKFVGMFAFAIWDEQDKALHLVRDRLGIKPLYYAQFEGMIIFASELKSICLHPFCTKNINETAVVSFFMKGYVPTPLSIYENVHKVKQGSILSFKFENNKTLKEETIYWSAKDIALNNYNKYSNLTHQNILELLEAQLTKSIGLRLLADVPVGAFLSGGIDSSSVVLTIRKLLNKDIKTFSIGFLEEDFNETSKAEKLARYLGTEHTSLTVTAQDAINLLPDIPKLTDEPFFDASIIPTYFVSKLARMQVKVALSGDGGDELFGGYNRYLWTDKIVKYSNPIPQNIRKIISKLMLFITPQSWEKIIGSLNFLIPSVYRQRNVSYKISKLAKVIKSTHPLEIYNILSSIFFENINPLFLNKNFNPSLLPPMEAISSNNVENMMYFDLMSYLPDDILVKVDRASMAVGLEARVPLLDHRLVEFSFGIPMQYKIHGNQNKWILRQFLRKYLPTEYIDQSKSGFGIPLDKWLRTTLKKWANNLLHENLDQQPFLNKDYVLKLWETHLSGQRNLQDELWCILTFLAWKENQITF